VKEAAIALGYVDGEKLSMDQLDKALAVLPMTRPPQ
jgi:fumarate hydratase class II